MAAGSVSAPDRSRLDGLVRRLRGFVETPVSDDLVADLGTALAGILLPSAIRERLRAEIRRSAEPVGRIRLRLHVTHPELAGLPWEFVLLDRDLAPGGFAALDSRFDLVREAPGPASGGPVSADPLRVLIAWADPRSAEYPAMIHLTDEVRSVLAALGAAECRRIQVDELRYASRSSLQRSLEDRPPHALHFIGHGDERPSGGVLALHGDRAGSAALLYGEELAEWLAPACTRLIVLSACRTASPLGGVAEALARKGVPAVVAMQAPLRDASAGLFARAFYGALAQGDTVEEAVREGRTSVRGVGPDWGVPVLYLSAEDSELFSAGPAAQAALPPANLPYLRNPHFVGRKDVLGRIHHALAPSGAGAPAPVALVGMGGLGKTQLAVEYAHAYLSEFPGGAFWLNARDSQRMKEEYAALGRFFNVPEALSTEERAGRVRDRLQQSPQPCLLILDNVTEETELALPAGLCRVLLTTRERDLARQRFQAIELPALDGEASAALLQAHQPARDERQREALREIAALLGSLPLALALAAHHVDRLGVSFSDYRDRLASNRVEVLKQARRRFVTSTGHDGGVWDAIDISHRSLDEIARRLLAAASCFAGRGISPALLVEAGDAGPREECEEAVADLVDCSLVTREQDGRLTVHELVRVYARGRMEDGERRGAVGRVGRVLASYLQRANEQMDWPETRREIAHCRAALDLCRAEALDEPLWMLQREMGEYLLLQRECEAARRCFEEALQVAQRLYGPAHIDSAFLQMKLGQVKEALGDREGARITVEASAELAERALGPDDPLLAEFYNSFGYVLRMEGRLAEALSWYRRALLIFERSRGRRDSRAATCLNNIAVVHELQGELVEALTCLREALDIDRTAFGAENYRVAIRLNNTGRVLRAKGHWSEAAACHTEALEIYRSVYGPDHVHAGWSLYFLAQAAATGGDVEAARGRAEEALPIFNRHYGPEDPRSRAVGSLLESLG
jgi:tetratricopeptide (TPR) repeat protein